MKRIQKEIMIFFSTFIFCYIAKKLDCYDVYILYLLVRILVEILDKGE